MSINRKLISKDEDSTESQTAWKTIWIAAVLSFIGSIQFSLYFSSIYPHLRMLDKDMNESFFGLTVALYSLGQIISSPLFGIWSNRGVLAPLTVGLLLMLIGNGLYISLEVVHLFPKRYLLLVSRFITGAGSGNVSVLRAYASTASTSADRSKAIAFVTCGQALGLVCGPVFQLFFLNLEHPGIRIFHLSLSLYTGPAWIAIFMNFSGLVLLFTMFKESYAGIIDEPASSEDLENSTVLPRIPKYDMIAVLICYSTRFCEMFVRSILEALGSPFGMAMFALNESQVVSYQAKAQGVVAAFAFLTYLVYIFLKLERYIKLRLGCVIALLGLAVFHLVTFSWPFLSTKVKLANRTTNFTVGCDVDRFDWCAHLPAVNVWTYYIAYSVIIGLSFPLLTISLNTLFSKVLGPILQGTEQGLLQVSSGVARMIGPLAASGLYTNYGPQTVWIMELGVLGLIILAWLLFFDRMIPLELPFALSRHSSTKSNRRPKSSAISGRSDSKRRVHPI